MFTPRNLLLLICALAVGLLFWRAFNVVPSPVRVASPAVARGDDPRPVGARATSVARGLSRREVVDFVRAQYRQEQLSRELDLEQQRYAGNYWEAGLDGRELAVLQRARETMIKELADEANQVLRDLLSGEGSEVLSFSAFFAADRPGPNLSFLSAASRMQLEREILGRAGGTSDEADWLERAAERVLSPAELTDYRRWNDSAAAALRERLAGFDPTEAEFLAIQRSAAGTDDTDLAAQLGTARFAEFSAIQAPAAQTALHDLRRLGLPLENVGWLALTRAQAVESIQAVWQNAAVSDREKRAQVERLERAYGAMIAAQLSLPAAALDGLSSAL